MQCEGTPISEHFLPDDAHRQHLPALDATGKEFYVILLSQGLTPIIGVCDDLGYFVGYAKDEFILMWSEKHGSTKSK